MALFMRMMILVGLRRASLDDIGSAVFKSW
jgi:hypothetical protein